MKSHNLYPTRYDGGLRGFTLIEILVVIGLLLLLVGLGYFLSLDVFRGETFRSERDVVLSTFQRARSYAMSNIDESAHGVHIESGSDAAYIIFTAPYNASDSRNEIIPAKKNVTFSGDMDFVFDQLSGNVDDPGLLSITDGVKTTVISVNNEGQISW